MGNQCFQVDHLDQFNTEFKTKHNIPKKKKIPVDFIHTFHNQKSYVLTDDSNSTDSDYGDYAYVNQITYRDIDKILNQNKSEFTKEIQQYFSFNITGSNNLEYGNQKLKSVNIPDNIQLTEEKVKSNLSKLLFARSLNRRSSLKDNHKSTKEQESNTVKYDETKGLKILFKRNKDLIDFDFIVGMLSSLSFLKDQLEKTNSLWKVIIREMSYVTIDSGKQFTKRGSCGEYMYIIKQGKVMTNNNKAFIETQAPCVIGERAIIGEKRRAYDYFTVTNVYAYVLHRDHFPFISSYLKKNIQADVNLRCLNNCYILNLLSKHQKEKLSSCMYIEHFPEKTYIIKDSEVISSMYILLSGDAEMKSVSQEYLKQDTLFSMQDSSSVVTTKMKPGDLAGYMEFIYTRPTNYSVYSSKSCICVSVTFDTLIETIHDSNYIRLFNNLLIKQLLYRDSYFKALCSEFDNHLLNKFTVTRHKRNQTVIPAGVNLSENVYIILEGDLFEEFDPRKKLKSYYGDVLCSFNVIKDIPKILEFNIKAISDCTIASIEKADLLIELGTSFDNIRQIILRKNLLLQTKALGQLTNFYLLALCDVMNYESFQEGEEIYKPGDGAGKMYIIISGKVTLNYQLKDSQDIIIKPLESPSFFGKGCITWMHKEKKYSSDRPTPKRNGYAYAQTNLECYSIDREDFAHVFQINPLLGRAISLRLYYRENDFPLTEFYFFEKKSQTGKSGRGHSFLARHMKPSNRLFMLKVYSKEIFHKHETLKDLAAMKQALQKIDSHFVINLIRTEKDENFVFFLFEYLHGVTLQSVLYQIPAYSYALAKFWGAQILLAIRDIHSNKFIHRNIMPDNILILKSGYLKLINLKFAATGQHKTELNTAPGSLAYMAPELIYAHSGYSYTVDYWSLAVILYQIVCKKLPFGNDCAEPSQIIASVINDEVTFPNRINDEHFINLITLMLQKSTDVRLANFEEIKEHQFFNEINFDMLESLGVPASFIPVFPKEHEDDVRPKTYQEFLDFLTEKEKEKEKAKEKIVSDTRNKSQPWIPNDWYKHF